MDIEKEPNKAVVKKGNALKDPSHSIDASTNLQVKADEKAKENNSLENRVDQSQCAKKGYLVSIVVCRTNNDKHQRRWDKVQFCMYCSAKVSKMARHLEDMHEKEIEVAEIIAIEIKDGESDEIKKKKRQERRRLFNRIRKRGNFNHNTEVLKRNQGLFVVEKRPNNEQPYTHYLPCEFCLGFYHKKELRFHVRICSEKPKDCKPGRNIQSSASMLLYATETASTCLQSVIRKMKVDDVSLCVKSDRLIIQYGNRMCLRLRKEGNQQYHISNKLRELARLVIETRKCCEEVTCLQDCVNPKNFGFVVEAATELSGWDEEEDCMATPSIGIKLGHSLKKCAKILKGEGIRNCSKTLKNMADDYTTLIELSWNDEISRVARTELEQRKWNAPKLLPLTSDLQVLRNHIKNVTASAVIALGVNNHDIVEYRNLATALLTSLILFNRRRAGEPALMKICDFENKLTTDSVINDEVKESLSQFELKLCKSFKRIELRGKRGRKVPLLLTKEMENGMKLLISLRKEVGTNPENPFVFPVIGNGSVKNVRGPDAIRKHVRLCNLKHPEAIYSTNLRKHIATLSQLINLEKNELEMLSTYLGHSLEIHQKFYRLPEDTLQLAKCSKLLLLMEQGGVGKQHGKTLKEIEIDLEGKRKNAK